MNQLLTCLSAVIIDHGQQAEMTCGRRLLADWVIKLTEACLSDQMLFLLLARIGVVQMLMQPRTKDIRSLFGEIATAFLVPIFANVDVVELYLLP